MRSTILVVSSNTTSEHVGGHVPPLPESRVPRPSKPMRPHAATASTIMHGPRRRTAQYISSSSHPRCRMSQQFSLPAIAERQRDAATGLPRLTHLPDEFAVVAVHLERSAHAHVIAAGVVTDASDRERT